MKRSDIDKIAAPTTIKVPNVFQSTPDKIIITPAIKKKITDVPKSGCCKINTTGKAVRIKIFKINHKSLITVVCKYFSLCLTITAAINTISAIFVNSRSEEHTSELQSRGHLVCRLLLEKRNI